MPEIICFARAFTHSVTITHKYNTQPQINNTYSYTTNHNNAHTKLQSFPLIPPTLTVWENR